MPVHPTYPGLYIEELPSSAHTITAAPTSITVFVGYVHPWQGECAAKGDAGDWGKPIRIFNFADYERIFGGLYRNASIGRSDVGYAVNQFFLNGGSDAYVVGLRPRYFGPGTQEAPIEGASDELCGIQFTARELTDADHQLTITIRNRVQRGIANDTADIMITYGPLVETFRGVRLRAGPPSDFTNPDVTTYDKDFIENRLAASRLVTVAPVAPATRYPAAYTFTGSGVQERIELIAMAPPSAFTDPELFNAQDFINAFADEGPLDKVEIFNLLAIPGVSDFAVWTAGLDFCERKRAFFIMDPPERATTDEIKEFMEDGRIPTSPSNGALYYPYLKTPDALLGDTVRLPPSGFVAGVYARTDTNRGVWKAPAGVETSISNTTGVVDEGRMTDMRQGVLNPLGVNVLRSFPGAGTVIWGARTIVTKSPGGEQWRYVPVRRMALFIEQTLLRNLGWVVFEPNDEPLWSAIRMSIEGFMLSLFHQSAFQGRSPSDSFLVQCDKTTTTQVDINNGIVNIVVGFRPLKPAEFVIIKIAQLAGQVQA